MTHMADWACISADTFFVEEVLNALPEATVILDRGRVLHVNDEFCRMFGYTAEDCGGQLLDDLVLPDGRLYESEMVMHSVKVNGCTALETQRRTSSGHLLDVYLLLKQLRLGGAADTEKTGLFVTYRDIRRQKQEELRLQYKVLHDALTGLPNRALFLDRVRLTLARLRRRPDRGFAVLFLDLDGFKKVNDTLGHAAGDKLLLEVANRLKSCLRPQDTVARLGGDEFALLLDETSDAKEVDQVAARMQVELQRPIIVSEAEARIAGSIGVAMATLEYDAPEALLRDADRAMYEAKAGGKGRHVIFMKSTAG